MTRRAWPRRARTSAALQAEPRRDGDPAGAAVRARAAAARRAAAAGRRPDRRRGHEHRRGARAGAQHAAHARIFTFGIGAGASQHLVNGLARAGGGSAEFIHPGERIEPKVVRQFGRLLSPALDRRPRLVGRARREAGAVGHPAGLRRRPPSPLCVRERGHDWRHPATVRLARRRRRAPCRSTSRSIPSRVVERPHRRDARGARAHPRARGEPRVDERARLAAARPQGDRREPGDRRAEHPLRPDVARDVVRRDRAARDAGPRRHAAAAHADRADVGMGRSGGGRTPPAERGAIDASAGVSGGADERSWCERPGDHDDCAARGPAVDDALEAGVGRTVPSAIKGALSRLGAGVAELDCRMRTPRHQRSRRPECTRAWSHSSRCNALTDRGS